MSSCSLINKDDLNVLYSQTFNSAAEPNSEFFWFLPSVIKKKKKKKKPDTVKGLINC